MKFSWWMSIIKIDRREHALTLKYMSMAVEGLEIYRRVISLWIGSKGETKVPYEC